MKKVLIADDEPFVLDVLNRILSRIGYQTTLADSWCQAIDAFREDAFDLVILDVLMPGRNGFEIAREIRKLRPDQIIIMITGMDTEAVLSRASRESVSVDDVLSKPFTCNKLAAVIQRVFHNREVSLSCSGACGSHTGKNSVSCCSDEMCDERTSEHRFFRVGEELATGKESGRCE
jgi:CheY-like chemotaxis protein